MIENRDRVEFYDKDGMISAAMSSIVPPVGSLISILNKTYSVTHVTYALDYTEDNSRRGMRANIVLERVR